MAKSKKEIEEEKVHFVVQFCSKCHQETTSIRKKWRENFKQFTEGSDFDDKEEWQSQISQKKLESRIRSAQGQSRDLLINNPSWFDMDSVNPQDQELVQYAPIFKKLMKYHLDKAEFPKRASTLLLLAFIAMATTSVGWTRRKLKNPKYIEWKWKQRAQKKGVQNFTDAVNSPIADALSLDEEGIADSIRSAASAFNSFISEDDPLDSLEPEPEPYFDLGGLDFKIPMPENVYWDTNVSYMADSKQRAFDEYVHLWEVFDLAEQGFFDKKKVKEIPATLPQAELSLKEKLHRNKNTTLHEDRVKLTYYFGPLILEDSKGNPKVKSHDWACIIANESVIIKEWEVYPYVEPSNHQENPLVDAAVKEIPFRPTGAGVGDNAVALDRQSDSNINLMNDQMRLNTIGFGVANYQALIDKDVIETGISPGIILRARGDADKVYKHHSLTSNVERQWDPVNQTINDSIDEQMGVSRISLGGPTQKSRTTAKEIDAVTGATDKAVNNISIDLEQTLLVPLLEKCFFRILQFGLDEVRSNPELKYVLTDTERDLLNRVRREDRLDKFAFAFQFKIKGFSSSSTKSDRINKLNEVLTVTSQSGTLNQIVNPRPIFTALLDELDLSEYTSQALVPVSEADKIIVENQLLALGTQIIPSQGDNHEAHIESHLQDPNPTPEKQMHVQQHQQIMMMMQEMQEQQQLAQQQATQQPQQALPQ